MKKWQWVLIVLVCCSFSFFLLYLFLLFFVFVFNSCKLFDLFALLLLLLLTCRWKLSFLLFNSFLIFNLILLSVKIWIKIFGSDGAQSKCIPKRLQKIYIKVLISLYHIDILSCCCCCFLFVFFFRFCLLCIFRKVQRACVLLLVYVYIVRFLDFRFRFLRLH